MHLAYIVSRFPSPTETFIAREMGELERRGHQIDLYALVRQSRAIVHPESAPFVARLAVATWSSLLRDNLYWLRSEPRLYLGAWRKSLWGNRFSPSFLLRAFAAVPAGAVFARRIKNDNVEHIHAHWATHSALAAFVAHQLTGIPFSFTAHAHDLYVEQSMLVEKYAAAKFVATISEFNIRFLEQVLNQGPNNKTVLVRCGVEDIETAKDDPDQKPDQLFRILVVASLEEYKGHAILLQALELLVQRGLKFECRLIGDGPLRATLEADIVKRALDEHVELLGRQTSDVVRKEMAECDAVCLPSIITQDGKMEGIPVALMEGMLLRKPVIASRLSGIPELVVHNESGLLVSPGEPGELADALQAVGADPELAARFGAAGQRRVRREFLLTKAVDVLESAFLS